MTTLNALFVFLHKWVKCRPSSGVAIWLWFSYSININGGTKGSTNHCTLVSELGTLAYITHLSSCSWGVIFHISISYPLVHHLKTLQRTWRRARMARDIIMQFILIGNGGTKNLDLNCCGVVSRIIEWRWVSLMLWLSEWHSKAQDSSHPTSRSLDASIISNS